MKNIMNKLNEDKKRLFEILKMNPQDNETYIKIREINNLIDCINNIIKVGIRPSEMSDREFNDMKNYIYSEPILDAVVPLIVSLETVRNDPNKELIYQYIDFELDDGNKI